MSHNSTETHWQVVPDLELRWLEWDDEFIVYNTGSGDTHLLNTLATALIQYLQQASASLSQLIDYSVNTLGVTPDEDFEKNLKDLFAELERSGLIERCAP